MGIIRNIIKKEFLQFKRDKRMFGISFVAPVIQLLLLGYAANLDVKEIPIVVCDLDKTQKSRELLLDFFNTDNFKLIGYAERFNDIDKFIDNGTATLAIVIPDGFSDRLIAGKKSQVQIITDGSETISATVGLNYASMIVIKYSRKVMLKKLERLKRAGINVASVNPEVRIWYNPELKNRNFMIPSVLGLILMVMTMLLTSLAIVKEKEVGTMEQIIVTPIKPYQLIIGKMMPFVIIGFIDIVLVIVVATFWFKVPVKGSIATLLGLCSIFLLTTLGLGLFTSTISRTQQQAMMTSVFFVLMPMMILSGFVFPIENMPKAIQYFTYIIPLRYFFVIIRGLFLKGVGLNELWDEALIMFVFGIFILSVSIFRFRKNLG